MISNAQEPSHGAKIKQVISKSTLISMLINGVNSRWSFQWGDARVATDISGQDRRFCERCGVSVQHPRK